MPRRRAKAMVERKSFDVNIRDDPELNCVFINNRRGRKFVRVKVILYKILMNKNLFYFKL